LEIHLNSMPPGALTRCCPGSKHFGGLKVIACYFSICRSHEVNLLKIRGSSQFRYESRPGMVLSERTVEGSSHIGNGRSRDPERPSTIEERLHEHENCRSRSSIDFINGHRILQHGVKGRCDEDSDVMYVDASTRHRHGTHSHRC
jgi:hypothetical protein